jgi:CheR methyltransferase, all-alpha domain
VLQSRLGRGFSQYRPGTLMRRIQRRMQVLQTHEVPSYIEQLRSQPTEAELLFRELLIGVTRFFRDAAAFEALETKVIPGMLVFDRGYYKGRFREGFRMPARRERSIQCRGPASESLRRTNPRGSGKLAVYGNLVGRRRWRGMLAPRSLRAESR